LRLGFREKYAPSHNSAAETTLKPSPRGCRSLSRWVTCATPLKWSITQSVSMRKVSDFIAAVRFASRSTRGHRFFALVHCHLLNPPTRRQCVPASLLLTPHVKRQL